jgi:hypothetical protein
MKVKSLRCCDYLEWLRQEEDYLVWELELPGSDMDYNSIKETLQIVREIKEIVSNYADKTAS